jgi:transposase
MTACFTDSATASNACLAHLKINRAIATRYDQLASSFLAMVHLATARYWPKFFHPA